MSKKRTPAKKAKPAKVNPYAKKPQKKNPWPLILAAAMCLALLIGGACLLFGRGDDSAAGTLAVTHKVEIDVANYGTIKADLYGEMAPITVENFVKLAKEGFYDGLTFHRIISGFMIQGGDPLGNGTGGSDQTIKGEFSLNGVNNTLSHARGVLSMARSSAYNSASSQFFIVHQDSTSLDGQYAAFGMVTEGLEIVDAICADTPVTDGNGTVEKENQPVITAIRVVE